MKGSMPPVRVWMEMLKNSTYAEIFNMPPVRAGLKGKKNVADLKHKK